MISYESMYEDPDENGYLPVEYCIGRYNLREGLFSVVSEIIDPGEFLIKNPFISSNQGPPEYGLKAEVRQFAVQTHHIDVFNRLVGSVRFTRNYRFS